MFWGGIKENAEMVEINLLPWRIYREEYIKNKNKQLALAALLFSIFVWAILHFMFIYSLKTETRVVYYLQKQSLKQSVLHTTNSFNNNAASLQNVTENFQRNRLQLIDFFRQITTDNEGIYWDAMLTQDNQIILTGRTHSYQRLLTFIQGYDELKNKFVMDIIKMKHLSESDMLEFSLHVYQVIYPLPNIIEKVHV
jgi:hypothetical protein